MSRSDEKGLVDPSTRRRIRVVSVTRDRQFRAGRAVERIETAVKAAGGSELDLILLAKSSGPIVRRIFNLLLRNLVTTILFSRVGPGKNFPRSMAIFSSGLAKKINQMNPDLVHLHWLGDATLSIREISEIHAPIIWTLHDSWPFSGANHLPRAPMHSGLFGPVHKVLDKSTAGRKARLWDMSVTAIAPNLSILEECAQSRISRNWELEKIPNPIDADFWCPGISISDETKSETEKSALTLMFVSGSNLHDPNKGFEHFGNLVEDLKNIPAASPLQVRGSVIGAAPIGLSRFNPGQLIFHGKINNDLQMRDLYRKADAVIILSRSETYPSVALEAMSCGTPVYGFAIPSLVEMLGPNLDRCLVEYGDVSKLADVILNDLLAGDLYETGREARRRSSYVSSSRAVGDSYWALYKRLSAVSVPGSP